MTRPDSERASTSSPEVRQADKDTCLAHSLIECVHPDDSLRRRNRSSDNYLQPMIAQIVEKGLED